LLAVGLDAMKKPPPPEEFAVARDASGELVMKPSSTMSDAEIEQERKLSRLLSVTHARRSARPMSDWTTARVSWRCRRLVDTFPRGHLPGNALRPQHAIDTASRNAELLGDCGRTKLA
jgi:hypothetical protein